MIEQEEQKITGSEVVYTFEEKALLDPARIPRHIAIIPDGNRRWARKNSKAIVEGHESGADVLMNTLKAAKDLGVKVLTIYTFSTENWLRPQGEIDALMRLLDFSLNSQRPKMIENGVRFNTIGDLSRLPPSIIENIQMTKAATAAMDTIDLVLGINYGSRDEICRAVKRMAADCQEKKLQKEDITEQTISQYLDTAPWPDPDLLIRTGGELRISNYLLWQISYAEIYIANALWPDFSAQHLLEAVISFQHRHRRLGGSS